MIYYEPFPPSLNRVAWIMRSGDTYINTNFTENPDDTDLWKWTKDGGAVKIADSEKMEPLI